MLVPSTRTSARDLFENRTLLHQSLQKHVKIRRNINTNCITYILFNFRWNIVLTQLAITSILLKKKHVQHNMCEIRYVTPPSVCFFGGSFIFFCILYRMASNVELSLHIYENEKLWHNMNITIYAKHHVHIIRSTAEITKYKRYVRSKWAVQSIWYK